MLLAGAYYYYHTIMVAHQFHLGPECKTFLPRGDFGGPEVHQIRTVQQLSLNMSSYTTLAELDSMASI
jgi:hypothetical protein